MKETESIREREFRTTSYRIEKEKREREEERDKCILGVSQVNRNVILCGRVVRREEWSFLKTINVMIINLTRGLFRRIREERK